LESLPLGDTKKSLALDVGVGVGVGVGEGGVGLGTGVGPGFGAGLGLGGAVGLLVEALLLPLPPQPIAINKKITATNQRNFFTAEELRGNEFGQANGSR
jgi:hypothetical protein